jgi:hypothetical protein
MNALEAFTFGLLEDGIGCWVMLGRNYSDGIKQG